MNRTFLASWTRGVRPRPLGVPYVQSNNTLMIMIHKSQSIMIHARNTLIQQSILYVMKFGCPCEFIVHKKCFNLCNGNLKDNMNLLQDTTVLGSMNTKQSRTETIPYKNVQQLCLCILQDYRVEKHKNAYRENVICVILSFTQTKKKHRK